MAESMGRSVLSSQFVAGLNPALKSKVTGVEGDFEQLLVKARFEEAKLRELPSTTPKKVTVAAAQNKPATENQSPPATTTSRASGLRCNICGSPQHLRRRCPYRYSK